VRIRSAPSFLLVAAVLAGAAGCAADRGIDQTSARADAAASTTTASTSTTTPSPTTTAVPSTTAPPPVAAAAPAVEVPAAPPLPPMPGQVAAQRTDSLEKLLGEVEAYLAAVDGAIGANEDEY
jgi:hypothetical protein